jgi:DNA-binding PadR family transcriptional regulator
MGKRPSRKREAEQLRLGPGSYALLGLVALRRSASAYDLKRGLGHLAREFWAMPHAQIYGETARLAAAGLLAAEQEEAGRRRRAYRITPAGRAALKA